MSISKLVEQDITDEILQDYINGDLGSDVRIQLESVLKSSKSIFFRYMEIKETLFLEKKGPHPTKEREDELLKTIQTKKTISHLLIRILLAKDKVSISYSDQETLDFRGVMADFAWRGSEAGPLTIVRIIDNHEVSLQLVPGERKEEYFLSVKCDPYQDLSCQLYVNERMMEENSRLNLGNFFANPILSTEDSELKFVKGGNILFTVSIFLQID
ncbi:MAG: hypothetical protein KDK90_25705 [Leptospiraceae bacterium]|nr:hypothetical protein [Leptospiraceae bacterium]